MNEHTGGHYLDTGDGLQPLTVAADSVLENGAQTAYRTYLDHRPGCSQCTHHSLMCKEAGALWEAYKEARDQTP